MTKLAINSKKTGIYIWCAVCFKIIDSKTLTFSSNIRACMYYESKLDYEAWRVNRISTTCTAAAKKMDEDIAIKMDEETQVMV